MLKIILSVLTVVLFTATFITLWRYEAWWVRDWDFPRLQLGLLALMLLLVETALLDFSQIWAWVITALSFICVCYQAWWVIPYTRLFPREVKSAAQEDADNTIAILASNVLTPNKNSAALLQLVRDYQPDILVTLETDVWWQSQLDELVNDYPYTIKCPLDNLYGMHVYSRLLLEDAKIQFLIEDNVPSMHALAHLRSGQKVQVHFLHPAPPSPTENDESTERDAELLLVAKSIADLRVPVIVAGDLNDVAWSATTRLFRKVSGLLDPRVGRGMFNSFHAKYPFVRWPLDHLFHSRHFVLVGIQRLASIGSDHFPMLIKLAYVPEEGMEQEGIEASAEEEQLAEEKISEVRPGKVHRPVG
jgi:endonuclease/exonuclease/phosphatase (EEP) superfamily protein YafD